MPSYRARPCPNCTYYIGFAIARPRPKNDGVTLNGICLNCGYKLPIRALLFGGRRGAQPASRAAAKASRPEPRASSRAVDPAPAFSAEARNYALDLRAIGQDLEALRVARFNLECSGSAYVVWSQETGPSPAEERAPKENPFRALLKRIGKGARRTAYRDCNRSRPPVTAHRYGEADIDRIDRAGRARRRPGGALTDGHALSQLMRTLGVLVSQRRQRLLAVSWQPLSIGVVVETTSGKRQLDLYRHDELYDFWVKCYLRRAGRAYSDVPT